MMLYNRQQDSNAWKRQYHPQIFIFNTVLAPFFEVQCYCASPGRQRPGAPALISDSVCAEDGGANLEPTESANCVCLDFNAWLWEISTNRLPSLVSVFFGCPQRVSRPRTPSKLSQTVLMIFIVSVSSKSWFQSCRVSIKFKSLL